MCSFIFTKSFSLSCKFFKEQCSVAAFKCRMSKSNVVSMRFRSCHFNPLNLNILNVILLFIIFCTGNLSFIKFPFKIFVCTKSCSGGILLCMQLNMQLCMTERRQIESHTNVIFFGFSAKFQPTIVRSARSSSVNCCS
jgi:hypothetical protein